jgi:homoserine kinase type II
MLILVLLEKHWMDNCDRNLSRKEINSILNHYDLGSITKFYPMEGGNINTSFNIQTDSGTFILTFFNLKSFETVNRLVDLLRYLEDNSYTTNKVKRSKQGVYIINYKNKPVILKEYIEGEEVQDLSLGQMWQLGRQIACLHQLPPIPSILKHHEYGLETFDDVFDYPHDFVSWLKNKKKFLRQNIGNTLPKGLIHGDIFWDNVLLDCNRVQAIIDFEEGCHYFLVFDLGMCTVGTCMKDRKLLLDKAKSLYMGYQSIRALNPEERENLKLFIEYGAIATAFWRFRQFNVLTKNEKLKNHYLEMKQIAHNIHNMPNTDFQEQVLEN